MDSTLILKHIRTLYALGALLLTIILVGLYLWIDAILPDPTNPWAPSLTLVQSIIPNLETVVIVAAVVVIVFHGSPVTDRIKSALALMSVKNLKAFYPAHRSVPWGEVYRNANQLDIIVNYYKSLPQLHFDELVEFFKHGGKLRLLLVNPENEELLQAVGRYMLKGLTPETLREKIHQSAEMYHSTFVAAAKQHPNMKGRFELWFSNELLHYTATVVNQTFLYLSPYAQFEEKPQLLSPVTVIDLSSDAELAGYWRDQLEQFFALTGSEKRSPARHVEGVTEYLHSTS